MVAVAVVHPHDCLMPTMQQQQQALYQRSLPFVTLSPSNNPHKNARSLNGKKPAHRASRKRNPRSAVPPSKTIPPDSSKNQLMGQVKILRRSEELTGSMGSLLPLPLPHEEFVPAQQANGFYAGSAAFVASPPPSSVPLPGFFAKRDFGSFSACDSATNDLRRILRLD